MAQVLEKRLFDTRLFDIDCSALLDAGETITSVASVAADQGGLSFGAPVVNDASVSYPDGRTVAAGKVVQVQIGGGSPPGPGQTLLCTVRARFATTLNPALEATVLLRLTNDVS